MKTGTDARMMRRIIFSFRKGTCLQSNVNRIFFENPNFSIPYRFQPHRNRTTESGRRLKAHESRVALIEVIGFNDSYGKIRGKFSISV